jgi:hypothetical protein
MKCDHTCLVLEVSRVPSLLPSVTYMGWWHQHVVRVIPTPSSLAFDMKMSDKQKSASPCAMQVKNWWKTISIEKKLDLISRLKKGEWIFDICHNVRCAVISVRTFCGNAVRITESAKSGTEALVCAARLPQSYWNQQYQKLWMWVSYSFIVLEINK